jgi:hypothetical protein
MKVITILEDIVKIIPEEITLMTAVLAGKCPGCGEWAGTLVKQYNSPEEALSDQDWPDLVCAPVECCPEEDPIWPTHFLVIYLGQIVQERPIGGEDLPVYRQEQH